MQNPDSVVLMEQKKADSLRDLHHQAEWHITNIDVSQQKRNPSAAFITSTLQQEANRKFGFSARDTMSIAQRLYENGLITYMRTDSPTLSGQAINAARNEVEKQYGKEYLFERVRNFGKKKGAQEAHEAIRPAGSSFVHPEKSGLSGREFKLYDLIWKRTVATQMAEARLEFTNVTITAEKDDTRADFKTSMKKILFPGLLNAYDEAYDDLERFLKHYEIFIH